MTRISLEQVAQNSKSGFLLSQWLPYLKCCMSVNLGISYETALTSVVD